MIEVAVPQDVSALIRNAMLGLGSWQIGESVNQPDRDFANLTTFANGDAANNKLLADLLLANNTEYAAHVPINRRATAEDLLIVRHFVLSEFDKLLHRYDNPPDTLWGVPSGGQSYAVERAKSTGLNVVHLAKVDQTPGQKTFKPATPDDAEILSKAKHMVACEDAGSEGASPYGALYDSDEFGLAALREKTMGIDYIWVRGNLTRILGRFPIQTMVHETIPVQIRRTDEFYRRFGHLAVELRVNR